MVDSKKLAETGRVTKLFHGSPISAKKVDIGQRTDIPFMTSQNAMITDRTTMGGNLRERDGLLVTNVAEINGF
jgi:hypothetical protein